MRVWWGLSATADATSKISLIDAKATAFRRARSQWEFNLEEGIANGWTRYVMPKGKHAAARSPLYLVEGRDTPL